MIAPVDGKVTFRAKLNFVTGRTTVECTSKDGFAASAVSSHLVYDQEVV